MIKFKDITVRNPTHFMALCFTMMKQDPKFKDRNDILTQVLVHKDRALFACAYGFFWASKDRKYSSEFYLTKEEALNK